MHTIYFSHGYRNREIPFNDFFTSLLNKMNFIISLDPPSDTVNSAKLERHLNYTSALIAILTDRDGEVSPYILYEINLAIRTRKPVLVFVEDSVNDDLLPSHIMIKRFSSNSYIREITEHLSTLSRFKSFLGDVQLPKYLIKEEKKSCLIVGDKKLNDYLKIKLRGLLNQKRYKIIYMDQLREQSSLEENFYYEIYKNNLAIYVHSNSLRNNHALGILQAFLIPTITLSLTEESNTSNIPSEYLSKKLFNNKEKIHYDIDIILKQIELFEEDFIDIDSSEKATKYLEALLNSHIDNRYTNDFRLNIIKEVHMGDTYHANQVGAQGKNAKATKNTFNQQNNYNDNDLKTLLIELPKLIEELKSNANDNSHYKEIGAIINAEDELKKGNPNNAMSELKKVGKWTLQVAEKIGVTIASAYIKKEAGL